MQTPLAVLPRLPDLIRQLALDFNTRCMTARLLPRMLELREQGLSYPKIGQRLGLTERQVEHVLRRKRQVLPQHLNRPKS